MPPAPNPEFSKGEAAKGGTHRVLVIGDIHEPFSNKKYMGFVKEVHDEFGCDTVVFIGDITDNHAMSYHEHNPDGLSAGAEIEKAKRNLKQWSAAFPNAFVCIGNHDELVYRKAVTHGLSKEVLKGFNEIYGTPETWKWGLSWEIDNVIYQHGTGSSGENAHKTRALKNRQSTVIGHVHSHAGVAYMASNKDLIFGMNVGCGIDIKSYAMMYGKDFASRPTLACGVVLSGKHAFVIPMDLGTRIRWV
jgi:predicted phosphodiesterase